MKSGKSLQEFAVELDRQNKVKRDFLVDTRSLRMEATGDVAPVLAMQDRRSNATTIFGINEIAHDQIGSRLSIPAKYYDRMRVEQPHLLAENVNTWFSANPEKRMVRTLDGTARAFLSNKYRPIDNYEIANVVLPVIQQMREARIESMELTDRRMYLKVVNPRLEREVAPGDIVQAGILITNSEVGMSSVSIQPLVYQLICTNGMVVNDAATRQYHIGSGNEAGDNNVLYRTQTLKAMDRAFMYKVADTVKAAVDEVRFGKVVELMKAAKGARMTTTDIPRVVELASKDFGIQQNESKGILDHLIRGGDFSLYGLANATTRQAQDVESYDRSTELESIGYDILKMPRGQWNRLADAAAA